jgi:hypothetical protein
MREGRYLAENIGHRIVRERAGAAHKGGDMDDDLFSHLRESILILLRTTFG